jgi:phosphoribosylglycinamide formyltransferase-1
VIRLGILISGSGSNMQAILDAVAAGALDAKVAVVLSNQHTAKGLEKARAAGVPTVVVDHRQYPERAAFDAEVVAALNAHDVEYVVLAGFMRIVTPVLLDAFPMRVLNVHPALLPAFPGVNAQTQALRYGVCIAGCTVHFVDNGTDTGPIVAQAAVPAYADDTEETLRARILAEEHALLPAVLQWIAEGRVSVEPGRPGEDRPRVIVRGVTTAVGVAPSARPGALPA